MADKSFGVKELNLLNASGTPTVTSPNNLNLNANTVAISTSATVGNNLTVSGQINVGSNIKIGNAGVVTATSFVGSGANLTGISAGISTDPSNVQATWKLGGGSGSGFTFIGPGQDGSEGNPDIYLVRGQRYLFDNTTLAGNHPFEFRNAANNADYTDGVSGAQNGLQYLNVQHDAPARLKYRCTIHTGSMLGDIYIIGGPEVISGVVTATTFVGNLTGNVTGTASANAVLTGSTNNQLVTVTGANAITGESGLTFDGSTLSLSPASSNAGRITIFGSEGQDARLSLISDEGDDHIDQYNLRVAASNNRFYIDQFESGAFQERFTIANGGDIGVGVASPDGRFHIMGGNLGGAGSVTANSAGDLLVLESNQSDGMSILVANDERANIYFGTTGTNGDVEAGIQYAHEAVSTTADRRAMIFRAGGGERARIQSGNFLVGRTNTITIAGDPSNACFEQLTDNGMPLTIHCDQSNQRGFGIYYTSGKNASDFIRCQIANSAKFLVTGNGNAQNANNSYGSISDVSLKENIVDANSQWDDIKNIRVRNYNFKESTGQPTHTQIGVVAQELETVSPKLVETSDKDGMKNVQYSVLYMKAVKALQEAMARIETLEAEVAALKGS